MNTFQILVSVAAGLLVLSNLPWRTWFTKGGGPVVTPPKTEVNDAVNVVPELDLTVSKNAPQKISAVVARWEELREVCDNLNLDGSRDKLDDVFPTFLDFVKDKEGPGPKEASSPNVKEGK